MGKGVRSHRVRKAFLDIIEKGWTESRAAREAGESVRFFREWAAEDENFKRDWEDADSTGTDRLEDVATKRAIKQSDQLLVHQLRARRPAKHREKPPEINVGVTNDFGTIDLDLQRKIAKATSENPGSGAPVEDKPAKSAAKA